MARKKPKPFRAATAVRSLAREIIGTPPPATALPNRKKKRTQQQKHKPTLERLLSEN